MNRGNYFRATLILISAFQLFSFQLSRGQNGREAVTQDTKTGAVLNSLPSNFGAGHLNVNGAAVNVTTNNLSDVPSPSTARNNLGNPKVYNVKTDYGAKGNTIGISDAAITSGTANLACATSLPFVSTAVDGGKVIVIKGAGAGAGYLLTTILSVTDSGHAVLAANASSTVSAADCKFGTDDSVAVQSAINAAFSAGGGEVYAPRATYMFNGPLDGTTNSVLKIPDNTGNAPITIKITGETGVPNSPFGPGVNGTNFYCPVVGSGTRPAFFADRAYNTTGIESNLSQIYPCFKNINFRVPDDPTIDGLRFYNSIDFEVDHCFVFPDSQIANIVQPTHGTIGINCPVVNNHTRITVRESEAFGFSVGVRCSEHTFFDNSVIVKCLTAVEAGNGYRPIYGHLTVEACPIIVSVLAPTALDLQINVERETSGWYAGGASEINDASNLATGRIVFNLVLSGSGISTSPLTKSGAGKLSFVNLIAGNITLGLAGTPISLGYNGTNLAGNAYYNSGWKYATAGSASIVAMLDGGAVSDLMMAPIGAQDAAITWTKSLSWFPDGGVAVGGGGDPGANNLSVAGLSASLPLETNASKVIITPSWAQFKTDAGLSNAVSGSNLTSGNVITGAGSSNIQDSSVALTQLEANYQSVSVSSAGNTNSNIASQLHAIKVSAAVGSGVYTSTVSIPTGGRVGGDRENFHLSFAASANPTVEIHNNTSVGTLLFTWTGDGTATEIAGQCVFDGSAWQLQDAHFVW